MGVIIKRNVILRAIVTPALRADILAELDRGVEDVEARVQQIDFQTKPYLTELQRTNLQQAIQVRKQIEAEKQKHEDLKAALEERKAQVKSLRDGDEIIRGTLESWVEVDEGDDLGEILAGTELVVKDDRVVEIRKHAPLELSEVEALPLNETPQAPARPAIITDI
jgi:hypothetical protein